MPKGTQKFKPGRLYGGRVNNVPTPAYIPDQKPTKEPGMVMSVEEMAEQLSIGRNFAYQLVQQPGFPAFSIGRRVLVNKKGLQEWIDAQCKKGLGTAAPAKLPEP